MNKYIFYSRLIIKPHVNRCKSVLTALFYDMDVETHGRNILGHSTPATYHSIVQLFSKHIRQILPIFLYGSDCWAISKTVARRIDALNQWCLRMLLGIKWYQFVRNDEVRRKTKQPKLTAIIQSRRLTLFGHIMRMDDNADAKRILLVLLRQTGEDNQVISASRGPAPSNRI